MIPIHYSLEKYHIHGSRILSRSFQVEKWDSEDDEDPENAEANTSMGSGMDIGNTSGDSHKMDIDEQSPTNPPPGSEDTDDSDDEDLDDPSDVAMVPMADMLNARYGSENVGISVSGEMLSGRLSHVHRPNCSMRKRTYGWSLRNPLRRVSK